MGKILNEKEAQTADNAFSNILTQEYNRCFPIRKNSENIVLKNMAYISLKGIDKDKE